MEYTWKPENELFEGHVKFRVPKYVERLKFIKECNFSISGNEVVGSGNTIDSMVKMIELAPKFIEEVKLRHKDSGTVFKSWDEIENDYRCDEIISSIASKIINGPSLGKI